MITATFFNTTALVQSVTVTDTPMGGEKKTFGTRIASLACRITARTLTEEDEFNKLTVRKIMRLYCDATSTNKAISESDRVIVNSTTYEVSGIKNPGLLDRHLEIDLEEIR